MTFAIASHIRKATAADGYRRCFCNIWTPEIDRELGVLLADHSIVDAAIILGKPRHQVYERAKALGLKSVPAIDRNTPSKAEWVAIASVKAKEARVRVDDILGKGRHRACARARWRAWEALLGSDQNYSVSGIARVTGHERTAILYGLSRLNGAPPKLSSRARLKIPD